MLAKDNRAEAVSQIIWWCVLNVSLCWNRPWVSNTCVVTFIWVTLPNGDVHHISPRWCNFSRSADHLEPVPNNCLLAASHWKDITIDSQFLDHGFTLQIEKTNGLKPQTKLNYLHLDQDWCPSDMGLRYRSSNPWSNHWCHIFLRCGCTDLKPASFDSQRSHPSKMHIHMYAHVIYK